MPSIDFYALTNSHREIQARFRTAPGSLVVFGVHLHYGLALTGNVDRFQGDPSGEIIVVTEHPHMLHTGDRVIITQSPAPETNGEWEVARLGDKLVRLRGSNFQGNTSASGAGWQLKSPDHTSPASGVAGSPDLWEVNQAVNRGGRYNVWGALNSNGSPSIVYSDVLTVDVS